MGFIRRKEPAKRPRLGRGGARDPFEHLHAEREQFEDEEPWFLAGENDGADIEVQAGVSSNLDAADLVDAARPDTSPTSADALPLEGSARRNDPLDDLFGDGPGGSVTEPGDGWTPSGPDTATPEAESRHVEPGGTDVTDLAPPPSPSPSSPDLFDLTPDQYGYADPSATALVEEPTTFEPPPGPRHLAPGTEVEDPPSEPLFAAEPSGLAHPAGPTEGDPSAAYQQPRHLPVEERFPRPDLPIEERFPRPDLPIEEPSPFPEHEGQVPEAPFIAAGQPLPHDAGAPEADLHRIAAGVGSEPTPPPSAEHRPLLAVDPGVPTDPENRAQPGSDTAVDTRSDHEGGAFLRGDRLDISDLIEGPPVGRPETHDVPSSLPPEPPDDAFTPTPEVEEALTRSPATTGSPAPSFDTTGPASASLEEQESQNGEVPPAPSAQLESALVASFRDLVAHQGPPPATPPGDEPTGTAPDPLGDQLGPIPDSPSDRVEPRRPHRAPRRPRGF